jgi:hypothetical protein
MSNSSVESGEPLTILTRVFKHVSNFAKAPNEDSLDLLRQRIIAAREPLGLLKDEFQRVATMQVFQSA